MAGSAFQPVADRTEARTPDHTEAEGIHSTFAAPFGKPGTTRRVHKQTLSDSVLGPGYKLNRMSTVENNKVTFAEPPADFDWAGIEDDKKTLTAEAREKMESAYENT